METVTFAVEENVTAALERALAHGRDMTGTMGEIARFMTKESQGNFRKQASPAGVPWKQSERARNEGGMTLVKSGDLFGSIKPDWGKDFAAAGPEASGGAAIYAKIHQFGGKVRPRAARAFIGPLAQSIGIPARPYLGYNEQMGAGIVEILADHLKAVFSAGESGVPGGAA